MISSLFRYEQDPSAFLSKVSECVNQSKDQLYNPDLSTADDPHAIVYDTIVYKVKIVFFRL